MKQAANMHRPLNSARYLTKQVNVILYNLDDCYFNACPAADRQIADYVRWQGHQDSRQYSLDLKSDTVSARGYL